MNGGALDSGVWENPNPLPSGPRDVVTVSGPNVAVAVDISLAYLASGVDVAFVIGSVQRAAVEVVSAGGTVQASTLATAAAGVPGVVAVRSCTVGGTTSAEGGFVIASSVAVDARIVP